MRAEQSFICPTQASSWNMLQTIPLFSSQRGWRQHSTQEPWSLQYLFLVFPSFSLKQLKANLFSSVTLSEVTMARWGVVV